MGIGNLTGMTAADSTGVNALLIAVCQELNVRAVLTTEVIPWARGAVREVDVARRLMHYAVNGRTVPKGVDDRLVTVKDPAVLTFSEDELRALQSRITDPNFRIFADRDGITVLNNDLFVRGTDMSRLGDLFAQLGVDEATHAFYLGTELARAALAVTLGKTYRQDAVLSWGYLTPEEAAKRPADATIAALARLSVSSTGGSVRDDRALPIVQALAPPLNRRVLRAARRVTIPSLPRQRDARDADGIPS